MIDFQKLPSPCFVLDEQLLDRNLAVIDRVRRVQAIVGGDIELVFLNDTEIMVVNEEGKVHGLKHNPTATRIFKENHPSLSDYIVGDVLVCKEEQIK